MLFSLGTNRRKLHLIGKDKRRGLQPGLAPGSTTLSGNCFLTEKADAGCERPEPSELIAKVTAIKELLRGRITEDLEEGVHVLGLPRLRLYSAVIGMEILPDARFALARNEI
jgi:hypothetical protein